MRIVLFNWRDRAHPRAGGAEVYTDTLLRELSLQGHECILFASASAGLKRSEENGFFRTIRAGSELTCRIYALLWLVKNRARIDLVVDEVNTLPFLSRVVKPRRTILLMHQLAREVWWKEAPFPLSLLGYALEPLMLQIYRGSPVITVSSSSADSIKAFGLGRQCFILENVLPQVKEPAKVGSALDSFGYVGRVTPSKRVDHVIKAFAKVARQRPQAQLTIIGRGPERYLRRLKDLVAQLGVTERVHFAGFLPARDRDVALASFACLVVASMREGWGLVVSEAAAYGVPAVGYAVPGLRDSIRDGATGLLVRPGDWKALSEAMLALLDDRARRDRLGAGARSMLAGYSIQHFSKKVSAIVGTLKFA